MNSGRALTNARARRFMLGIQEVMGQSGLNTILRQADLSRYASALPPNNNESGLLAAEYAALMQAIENYYGRGARGTLTRIGYASFNELVRSKPAAATSYQLLLRVLPAQSRKLTVLNWLAREMAGPGGQVTVHLDDQRIAFVDHDGDATVGRKRDTGICWVTLGEIQEALKWGTGREHEVAEMSCKATGSPACRFDIGDILG